MSTFSHRRFNVKVNLLSRSNLVLSNLCIDPSNTTILSYMAKLSPVPLLRVVILKMKQLSLELIDRQNNLELNFMSWKSGFTQHRSNADQKANRIVLLVE